MINGKSTVNKLYRIVSFYCCTCTTGKQSITYTPINSIVTPRTRAYLNPTNYSLNMSTINRQCPQKYKGYQSKAKPEGIEGSCRMLKKQSIPQRDGIVLPSCNNNLNHQFSLYWANDKTIQLHDKIF